MVKYLIQLVLNIYYFIDYVKNYVIISIIFQFYLQSKLYILRSRVGGEGK
jgi:hypothetical protein